jgi:hypothetical protein
MAIDTKIPGLTIEFIKIGANLWARIGHKESGLRAVDFTREPLKMGKREFAKRVDASVLNSVDWTQGFEALGTKEIFDVAMKARIEILA